MSEETNTEVQEPSTTEPNTEGSQPTEDKTAIRKQLSIIGNEKKAAEARAEAAEAKLREIDDAEAAREADRAKKAGEFDLIEQRYQDQIKQLETDRKADARKLVVAKVEAKLVGLNELELLGAKSKVPEDLTSEGVEEWAQNFRKENAPLFDKKTAGVGSGSTGDPARGGTGKSTADELLAEADTRDVEGWSKTIQTSRAMKQSGE